MSSDPTITPPSPDVAETPTIERPRVRFSRASWVITGVVRISYRAWTRIAARLFPEESRAEHIAQAIHIPLPDKLNMSWVTEHLAVGGRIHPEDIRALALSGITHVIDTRSEYRKLMRVMVVWFVVVQ